MKRILFVTNGHGEAAIAARVAAELRSLRSDFTTDHLPLVGEGFDAPHFADVGPRRAMPSGGLVAMGNVANLTKDLRAGLLRLVVAQALFLRRAAHTYAATFAVGDTYALLMARLARLPTVFVGTAKSIYVAAYGPLERVVLRSAVRVFVRDEATAEWLRARGVAAQAPGNVIADLARGSTVFSWPPGTRIALLPGSRSAAYDDARLLARVVAELAKTVPVAAVLSVAPTLQAEGFAAVLRAEGWDVAPAEGAVAFTAAPGGGAAPLLWAWRDEVAGVLEGVTLAIGQAGTANEIAASLGIPVVALETRSSTRAGWYRMRQARLLGESLRVVPGAPITAAREIAMLLSDERRLDAMRLAGPARMGGPGGAAAIGAATVGPLAGECGW